MLFLFSRQFLGFGESDVPGPDLPAPGFRDRLRRLPKRVRVFDPRSRRTLPLWTGNLIYPILS
jgi:hypothetical protein